MDPPPAGATTHWDAGATLADRFRAHAADAQHLYVYAIRGMAEDWEAGGPIRVVRRTFAWPYELDRHERQKPEVRTRLWDPDASRSIPRRRLGIAHYHGVPVTLGGPT